MLNLYKAVLVLKLTGVLAFAGGFAAAFLASGLPERRRAVHGLASPALLLVWLTGYFLTTELQIPLTELWILGALVLSLVSMLALVHSVSRDRRTRPVFLVAAIPLLLVLVLMVFRPTWATLGAP
ncbi:MAG: hypothetical protein JWN48_2205 [Myxococcaceae bacterium]|nr:hypothetical protein [Myxococcaceae bacterium]